MCIIDWFCFRRDLEVAQSSIYIVGVQLCNDPTSTKLDFSGEKKDCIILKQMHPWNWYFFFISSGHAYHMFICCKFCQDQGSCNRFIADVCRKPIVLFRAINGQGYYDVNFQFKLPCIFHKKICVSLACRV